MPLAIHPFIVVGWRLSVRFGRNAAAEASFAQEVAESMDFIGFVSEYGDTIRCAIEDHLGEEAVIAISWTQEQINNAAPTIDEGVYLGVRTEVVAPSVAPVSL